MDCRVKPGNDGACFSRKRDLTTATTHHHTPTPTGAPPMDYDITDSAPEHKAGIAGRDEFDELRSTFEQFKAANDERLAAIERRRPDPLLEEKVDRISAAIDTNNRRVDDIALKQARPALDVRGRVPETAGSREHKSAFDLYVRSGETSGLRALESKAMSVSSNPDGGYLVPVELETAVGERLKNISPIRGLASVRVISSSIYKKPF